MGSVKTTDVMVLGIANWPPGIRTSPAGDDGLGVRAALYSFGFLARRAAADRLDIHEQEIKVGLRVLRAPAGGIIGQIFISDSLENGAGYASFLGEPAETEALLQYMVGQSDPTFHGFLVDQQHAGPGPSACTTSCPDCLRDFSNLPYHSILDWRLGLDLARLALNPTAAIDFTVPYWQGIDISAAAPYFGAMPGWQPVSFAGLQAGRHGSQAEIITHPLWDCDPAVSGRSSQTRTRRQWALDAILQGCGASRSSKCCVGRSEHAGPISPRHLLLVVQVANASLESKRNHACRLHSGQHRSPGTRRSPSSSDQSRSPRTTRTICKGRTSGRNTMSDGPADQKE